MDVSGRTVGACESPDSLALAVTIWGIVWPSSPRICPGSDRRKRENKAMIITNTLPKNFLVRRPTIEDVNAVYELLCTCDIAEYGVPDTTEEELRSEWSSSTLD